MLDNLGGCGAGMWLIKTAPSTMPSLSSAKLISYLGVVSSYLNQGWLYAQQKRPEGDKQDFLWQSEMTSTEVT